jgi:hypothetical protein
MRERLTWLAQIRSIAVGALVLAALVINGSALAGETCALIENGSFTDGLGDWVPDQVLTIEGDGSADIEHGIFDSNGLGGMDENVFGFIIDALATGVQKAGFGETTVDVSVSRTLTLDCPTLEFIMHGESDIHWWGVATIDWVVELDVEDARGVVHTVPIVEQIVPTTPTSCGIGLGLGGFYNHPFNANVTTVDLAAATGIPLGETITLTFRFVLHLDAPGVCDQAHYDTYFIIDEVTFCCPDEPPPVCDGDFVSSATFQPPPDGQVDGADLAYLLGEWGENPGSLADIVSSATFAPPPDGVVDAADLAVLLGAWGVCR